MRNEKRAGDSPKEGESWEVTRACGHKFTTRHDASKSPQQPLPLTTTTEGPRHPTTAALQFPTRHCLCHSAFSLLFHVLGVLVICCLVSAFPTTHFYNPGIRDLSATTTAASSAWYNRLCLPARPVYHTSQKDFTQYMRLVSNQKFSSIPFRHKISTDRLTALQRTSFRPRRPPGQ